MKKALKSLILADLMFMILLGLYASAEGIMADLLYFSAYLLPIPIALALNRTQTGGDAQILPDRNGARLMLPLIAPTLLIIPLLSALTALVLELFGFEDKTVIEESLPVAIVIYALLPAMLEELLFRYLPMRLAARYSPRMTVIISALFFALLHCDLFRMPYAFAAGVIFMMIDLACGSILPSFIIHFINNVLSVISILYLKEPVGEAVLLAVLAVAALISLVFIVKRREEYLLCAKRIFTKRDADAEVDASIAALIVPAAIMTLLNLFA